MAVRLEQEVVVKVALHKMKKIVFYILTFIYSISFSQETIPELLQQYNSKNIPYISVQELAMPKTKAHILDTRETKEYNVSHIKNSIHVGYDLFNLDSILKQFPDKDKKLVVYCSIGIRSERIAEKLNKVGYTNVFNLYGGIFEWKNNDFIIFDSNENETENIHAFNKEWSKWLLKGRKVFEKED